MKFLFFLFSLSFESFENVLNSTCKPSSRWKKNNAIKKKRTSLLSIVWIECFSHDSVIFFFVRFAQASFSQYTFFIKPKPSYSIIIIVITIIIIMFGYGLYLTYDILLKEPHRHWNRKWKYIMWEFNVDYVCSIRCCFFLSFGTQMNTVHLASNANKWQGDDVNTSLSLSELGQKRPSRKSTFTRIF